MLRSAILSWLVMVFAASSLVGAGSAQALEGVGYGATEDAARRAAAADLAAAIQVQVKAIVESCTRVVGRQAEDCGSRVVQRTAADLPLLGLHYVRIPGGSEPFGARAVLTGETSIPLYLQQLERLRRDYTASREAFAGTAERNRKHELLGKQIALLRGIQDHRLVATALGAKVDDLPESEAGLIAQKESLEDKADSIPFAARLLMRELAGTVVEAAPLRASGSREATPLGNALADALRVEMTGRGGPAMRLAGEYRLLTNGDVDIVLEIRADGGNDLAGVRTTRLLKDGYSGYRAEPLAPDFERLLREGEAVSGDLRAELVTTQGTNALRFRDGESVKIAARLSRSAYFYIVGHVVTPDGQFSYLLPLQESEGDGRFLRYVPADHANRYLEIGEFIVEPPYGTEFLQIIASTQKPANALPRYRHDPSRGHYVILGSHNNASAGLRNTRALKPSTKAGGQVSVAEGTLAFTTTPK